MSKPRWFRRAAEQGDVLAQANLGAIYGNAEGVPEDDIESYAWSSIAAAQGNAIAKANKAKDDRQFSRSQLAKGEKLAREYWERYATPFR